MNDDLLTTQQVALAAGVTAARVRHLKDIGVVTPVILSNRGDRHRQGPLTADMYDPDAVETIKARQERPKPWQQYPRDMHGSAQRGWQASAESRRRQVTE